MRFCTDACRPVRVVAMSHRLIIMPSSPALVPELAPADAAGRKLRRALEQLLIGDTIIDLVGSRDQRWYTAHAGSFAAWGAPQVRVGGGHYLAELVPRSVLGPHARVRETRDCLEPVAADATTVLAIDGSAGLTERAPLSLLETAADTDRWCRALLAGEEGAFRHADELLAGGIVEPDLWIQLHKLLTSSDWSCRLVAADTTLGVGRYVAVAERA